MEFDEKTPNHRFFPLYWRFSHSTMPKCLTVIALVVEQLLVVQLDDVRAHVVEETLNYENLENFKITNYKSIFK